MYSSLVFQFPVFWLDLPLPFHYITVDRARVYVVITFRYFNSIFLCSVKCRCLFTVVAALSVHGRLFHSPPPSFTEGKFFVERQESQRLLSSNDRLTGVKAVKVPNDKGRHSTLPSISLFNAIDGYRFFILTSSHCSDQQGTCCWRSVLKSCGGHLGVEWSKSCAVGWFHPVNKGSVVKQGCTVESCIFLGIWILNSYNKPKNLKI